MEKKLPKKKKDMDVNGKNIPTIPDITVSYSNNKCELKYNNRCWKRDNRVIEFRNDISSLSVSGLENINVQENIRHIRKDIYGLSSDELAALIGVTGKTIRNIETGKTDKIDHITLIKCAKLFSNIPTKKGTYQTVSVDMLLGITPFSSVTNQIISAQTGLDNESIETLKRLNTMDREFKKINLSQVEKSGHFASSIFFNLVMPVINHLLKSNQLRDIINVFWRYAYSDLKVPVYEEKGKMKKIPYSEQYKGDVLLASENNFKDALPLPMNEKFLKSAALIQAGDYFDELAQTFRDEFSNIDNMGKNIDSLIKP